MASLLKASNHHVRISRQDPPCERGDRKAGAMQQGSQTTVND